MAQGVIGLRNVDIGVPDVAATTKFYTDVWGLLPVFERSSSVYLRGTGPYHHIVAIHQRPKPQLLRVTLTAADKASVDAIAVALRQVGAKEIEPAAPVAEPGGGYGFAFQDLEGRTLRIVAGDERHADAGDHPDRPRKISHVVLNSTDTVAGTAFYAQALGFKVSDRTRMMTFLRCSKDHHSIALVNAKERTLHHIAFEMKDWDAVMRGAGRMRDNGYPIEWGVGRHGPGNNVFSYFVDPNGMPIEYTAEVMQIDDGYKVGGPEDWKWPPGRIDQWGIGVGPTKRLEEAHHIFGFPPEIFHPAL